MTTNDTLRVTDSRTGRSYELPIVDGAIRAIDLRQIKTSDDDFGLLSYDPAFQNTASCRSAITFIDGDKGILRYRGYPIEELASRASFLDVAWLLLRGEMPDKDESAGWAHQISHHTYVHENVKKFIDGFHHDAHPMGILVSTLAALSTFYPEASAVHDRANQDEQVVRLIAKMPTLAAFAYRHARGLPYAYPDDDLSYAGNFLNMMARMTEPKYEPNPILEHALDVLFILHADHEQNCSTNAMRSVSSSQVDPYSAAAAAAAALYGPLHGGANEQVLKMLREIGSVENVPAYINRVKSGELRLMGFGHRVYKNYDPRATIIKGVADQVFEVTGRNPLLDIALELERIALEDEYFISHKLYPNVDFYSGIIYQAMGFPVAMFPVLFAIGRMPGWLAHWQEGSTDKEQKIARPRQIYVGETMRHLNGEDGEGGAGRLTTAGWLDLPPGSAFGLANLPYGVFSDGDGDGARVGVRIGDSVLDLARALGDDVFGEPSLNAFMAQGRARWTEVRARITELLTAGQHHGTAEAALRPLSAVRLHLPFTPGDYVDFFGNEYHAANAGRIFRPDGEPLTPNWKHMPIGYHGRSGTIVPSGTPVRRPCGQRRGAARPDVRAVPAARFRGRGRLRGRRRLVRAGAGERLRRARVRRVPAQRLVLPRPAGLGVPAARPVPGQVVRHVGLAVGGPARRAGTRQGHPAAAGPGAAALPGRRRPVGPGPRARGAAERAAGGAPAVRHHLLDGRADAGPHDRERRVRPHRRPVRLGHGQRP